MVIDRPGIDFDAAKQSRRRGCLVRLVGELYAYRLLDSRAILRILYWLVPKQDTP